VLEALGQDVTEEELREIVLSIDDSGDGEIDFPCAPLSARARRPSPIDILQILMRSDGSYARAGSS